MESTDRSQEAATQTAFILPSLQPAAFIIISQQFQLDPGQTLLTGLSVSVGRVPDPRRDACSS